MTLNVPAPGTVIRYSYLWEHEARIGLEEGLKDRPCAVALAIEQSNDDTYVLVVPITHTPPSDPRTAIEIPTQVKQRLGLDDERSWIICNEANRFLWPGPDLRPLPDRDGDRRLAYGTLPPRLFDAAKERLINFIKEKRFSSVKRSE